MGATMEFLGLPFAYFTPETTLPVATILSALLGFGLLVVRAPLRVVGKGARGVVKWVRSRFAPSDL
jgi:hypothetical protein